MKKNILLSLLIGFFSLIITDSCNSDKGRRGYEEQSPTSIEIKKIMDKKWESDLKKWMEQEMQKKNSRFKSEPEILSGSF